MKLWHLGYIGSISHTQATLLLYHFETSLDYKLCTLNLSITHPALTVRLRNGAEIPNIIAPIQESHTPEFWDYF